mgnify:CR=1 FL=1
MTIKFTGNGSLSKKPSSNALAQPKTEFAYYYFNLVLIQIWVNK